MHVLCKDTLYGLYVIISYVYIYIYHIIVIMVNILLPFDVAAAVLLYKLALARAY